MKCRRMVSRYRVADLEETKKRGSAFKKGIMGAADKLVCQAHSCTFLKNYIPRMFLSPPNLKLQSHLMPSVSGTELWCLSEETSIRK